MHSVWGEDAEDFASWAKMRLMEDDYAVLRKYRGESELRTYLTVVVTRLFHEHGRDRMGRWRNSAAAERLGQLAKDLEILVHRDGCRLAEAGERLRSAGRTTLSDTELARVLAQLPERAPLRPREVGPEPLEMAPGTARADEHVVAAETGERRSVVLAALFRAMNGLEPQDRLLVRMNLAEGRSLADVARSLRVEQKPLYRRIERLRAGLRRALEEAGISGEDVRELLDEGGA